MHFGSVKFYLLPLVMLIGLAGYYSPWYLGPTTPILQLAVLWFVPFLIAWIIALMQIKKGLKIIKSNRCVAVHMLVSGGIILLLYLVWLVLAINGYLLLD